MLNKGDTFGKWTVIDDTPQQDKFYQYRYWCECECGRQSLVLESNLRKQLSTQCSTCGRSTHGLSQTPEYRAWKAMRYRCYYPKCDAYPGYGGRGVRVCDRWLGDDGFINFYNDMGKRPSDNHQLDKDKLGDGMLYSPETCCWLIKDENLSGEHRRTPKNAITDEDVYLVKKLHSFGILGVDIKSFTTFSVNTISDIKSGKRDYSSHRTSL